MAITPFKVVQGHRYWYQSKAIYDFLLVINSNLPSTLHRFQVTAAKFWLEMVGRHTLTPSLGVIPCESPANTAISDIPLKTRFFWLHFSRRMFRCIFNHFCVIRPKSYRVRRINANYMAVTPFKVIQGHRFWYQSKAHMRLPISD